MAGGGRRISSNGRILSNSSNASRYNTVYSTQAAGASGSGCMMTGASDEIR